MTYACTAVRLGESREWTKTAVTTGGGGGFVLNGPELNEDPFFPPISGTSFTNRGPVKEKFVVYRSSLVCVYAHAWDLFKIHHPFSQAALVTEGIGNNVVTNNRRFAELLRFASPHVQGCTNSYLVF